VDRRKIADTVEGWEPSKVLREARDLSKAMELRSAAETFSVAADKYVEGGNPEKALEANKRALKTVLVEIKNSMDQNTMRRAFEGAVFSIELLKEIIKELKAIEGVEKIKEIRERDRDNALGRDAADKLSEEAKAQLQYYNINSFYFKSEEAAHKKLRKAFNALKREDYMELQRDMKFILNVIGTIIDIEYKIEGYDISPMSIRYRKR
jgi:hypothetical protein